MKQNHNPQYNQGAFKMATERKDVPVEHTWDVECIFATPEEWENAFKALKARLPELAEFEGTLNTRENILDYFKLSSEPEVLAGRLSIYAQCNSDQDLGDSTNTERKGRLEQFFSELSAVTAFVVPELAKQTDEFLLALANDPDFSDYDMRLKEIVRVKKHLLSSAEERVLASFSDVLSASHDIAEKLRDVDMRFPAVKAWGGEEHELTNASFLLLRMNPDRNVRQDAVQKFFDTYNKYRETLATSLNAHVRSVIVEAKMRGHTSVVANFMSGDNIPIGVPQTLFDATNEHLHLLHRYCALRQRVLGLNDSLHWHDLYVPMVSGVKNQYTYNEAVQLTADAVAPLGADYVNRLHAGLTTERWVDIYPNKGKCSGAYSNGRSDTKPYILLNFMGRLNDVSTLAHEAGHSMHTELAKASQPLTKMDYSIFVAEIASIFNETLLEHLLLGRTDDPKIKAFLLNQQMESVRTSFFRQTMFAEFEALIFEHVWAGGVLTADFLEEKYFELNQRYYGPDTVINDEVRAEWSFIPHFYYEFYTFQYATGIACARYFATQVLNGGQKEVDNYLGFLSAGGSDYATEVLKKAGLDVTQPDYIVALMKSFETAMDEFEKLLEE